MQGHADESSRRPLPPTTTTTTHARTSTPKRSLPLPTRNLKLTTPRRTPPTQHLLRLLCHGFPPEVSQTITTSVGKSGTDVVTFPEFVAGVRSCLVLEQLFVRAELLFRAVEKKGRSIWGSDGAGASASAAAISATTKTKKKKKKKETTEAAAAAAAAAAATTVDAADFIRYLEDGRRAATLLGLGRGETFRVGEVDDVLGEELGTGGGGSGGGSGGGGSGNGYVDNNNTYTWNRAKAQLLADGDVQKAVLSASGGGGARPGRVLLREFVVCLFRLITG